jgi:hypothetical protein
VTEACSTGDTAFLDYGLPNGRVLVTATYYVLAGRGEGTFEPTPEYVHRTADAFRTAFVPGRSCPSSPNPSTRPSKTRSHRPFTGSSGRPIRIAVFPTFYRRVAAHTCTYLLPRRGLRRRRGGVNGSAVGRSVA